MSIRYANRDSDTFCDPVSDLRYIAGWCRRHKRCAPPHRIPVEVWSGGDDGLTQRLQDAMERAFQASPDFVMSFGKKPGTLVVTIPTHVKWQNVSDRMLVRYKLEFSSASGQRLASREGQCWADEYPKCAARILDDAKAAARKIRH